MSGLQFEDDNQQPSGENHSRGHGGERRNSNRSQDRRNTADKQFSNLIDLLKPQATGKSMQPRAEDALKWLELSLARNPNVIEGHEIRLGAVSKEKGYSVKYPGIIITLFKTGSDRVVTHTLMLDDGEQLMPLRRTVFNGEDITPYPVPSLVYDERYETAVKTEVLDIWKDKADLKYASSGVTVVPANFSIAKPNEQNVNNDLNPLDSIFIHVVESLSSFHRWLRRDDSKVKLGAAFDDRNEQLVANIDQVPTIEFDQLGQPRRSDFCISLSIKRRDDERQDRNKQLSYNDEQQTDSGTILRVSGYVLPYFTMPDTEQRKPRNFGVNFVITGIEGQSTPSPELWLYGIAAVSVLTNNDMWVDGFKPALINADPNRNLGGLFLEIADENGDPMDRKEYGNTEGDLLLQDVDYLFSSDFVVSLDCADSGPTAWITELFVENDIDAIDEAANNLSDNRYGDHIQKAADPIYMSETRRFYGGEYSAAHSVRDLRDVDYLYLINCFDPDQSLQAAQDWDESLSDSTEFGLHTRYQLMQDALGHGVFKITSQVDRVRISDDLFEGLIDALGDMNMLPSFDNFTKGFRPRQRLEAGNVAGGMSTKEVGGHYRGRSARGTFRRSRGFRDRD